MLSDGLFSVRDVIRGRTIEATAARINALVGERQRLRSEQADPETLERNRLAIAAEQRELSQALIARYLPVASTRAA